MTANVHTAVTSETKRGGGMAPLRLHMTVPVWEPIPVKGLLPLPYMSGRLIADSSRTSVPRASGSALGRPTHQRSGLKSAYAPSRPITMNTARPRRFRSTASDCRARDGTSRRPQRSKP